MKFSGMQNGKIAATIGCAVLAMMFLVSSAAAGTTYYTNLQKYKWSSCSVCAGAGGSGSSAPYSQALYISSPSLSGTASKFFLGGTNNYSNALWWKQVGANSAAHNFKYDLYFYLQNPSAAQALEFDVNQSVGGHKYIFGTECDIKASGTWMVWSKSYGWRSTGIGCHQPSAYKWHHLTWQFQRTSSSQVKFISVTLDGVTHYVNRTYAPKGSSVNELNAAFQMDGNKYQTDYYVWLDKVTLTAW